MERTVSSFQAHSEARIVVSAAANPVRAADRNTPSLIDHGLTATGVIVLTVVIGRWLLGRGTDPLRAAPARPHRLHEEAVALAVLVYLTAGVALAGIVQAATGQTGSVLARVLVGNGAQLAGIGVCLVIGARRFVGGLAGFCIGLGEVPLRVHVSVTLVVTVLALGVCPMTADASVYVIRHLVPGYEPEPHPTIAALHDDAQPIGVIIALVVGAAVIAPIAEELFFRGLFQTFLGKRLFGRWRAILLASLVFGSIHVSQPHAVAALVLLAVFMGYAYERTGSLVSPILIHAAFNVKSLIWDAWA